MPLVNAKCTNCGATLEVDSAKDAAICPYCGSAYIVEKAINNYNITNNTTNNINADVVNVYGGDGADFVIRGGVLEKYKGAATEVVIPDNVTVIGGGAFYSCEGITSVVIPDSVSVIGDRAFEGCNNITSVVIPDSVVEIRRAAFRNCKRLKEVVLPKKIDTIEAYTFKFCGLISIEIPSSVISIGDEAFSYCENLTRIEIPRSVTYIGEMAFYHCPNLKEVTIHGEPQTGWDGLGIFDGCDQLTVINASQEWKEQHYSQAKCLKEYSSYVPYHQTGFCYIATAVYGSYDCPQVWTLRRYRDNYLAESLPGRLFVRSYYAISPTIVRWFKDKEWFHQFWRNKLDKKVLKLNQKGYLDTPYSDKI